MAHSRTKSHSAPRTQCELRICITRPRRPAASFTRLAALIAVGGLLCTFVSPTSAAGSDASHVKAALVYNVLKFTRWPVDSFLAFDSAVRICVVGQTKVRRHLESDLADKSIQGRPIEVQAFEADASDFDPAVCHAVFVGSSEKNRAKHWTDRLSGTRVATIGETEGFARQGGMVNLIPKGGKMKLELNVGAAKLNGLTFSSQLQRIALPVQTE